MCLFCPSHEHLCHGGVSCLDAYVSAPLPRHKRGSSRHVFWHIDDWVRPIGNLCRRKNSGVVVATFCPGLLSINCLRLFGRAAVLLVDVMDDAHRRDFMLFRDRHDTAICSHRGHSSRLNCNNARKHPLHGLCAKYFYHSLVRGCNLPHAHWVGIRCVELKRGRFFMHAHVVTWRVGQFAPLALTTTLFVL